MDHEPGDREAAEGDHELVGQGPRARPDGVGRARHHDHRRPVAEAHERDVEDGIEPWQEVEGVEAGPEVEEAEGAGRVVGEVDAGGDLEDPHRRGEPDQPHRHPVGEDEEREREHPGRRLHEQHRRDVERARVRKQDAEDAEEHPGERDVGAGTGERRDLATVVALPISGIEGSRAGTLAGIGTLEHCQAHYEHFLVSSRRPRSTAVLRSSYRQNRRGT